MPQLDFSNLYSQMLWLSISFFLTFITISKLFVPKVRAMLMEREALIRANLDVAEKSLHEYNHINVALENSLKRARLKATVLREQA